MFNKSVYILVYLLQLFMFIMIKKGTNNYQLEKFHMMFKQPYHTEVTLVELHIASKSLEVL